MGCYVQDYKPLGEETTRSLNEMFEQIDGCRNCINRNWCGSYSAWGLPCDEYIREDKS
jgi:hypothetical protein